MSWSPGLITRIDSEWMEVKVPTGEDCTVCPAKNACSFEGPKKAYRVFQVPRQGNYAAGDRVEVEDPASVLGVAFAVFVVAPVVLLAVGFGLTARFDNAARLPILLWTAGVTCWLAIIFLANRWIIRATRFQTRIRQGKKSPGFRQTGMSTDD